MNRFECDQGFLLEGSDISECLDDGNGDEFGRWSSRPPTCTRIRCNPPQEDPENGNVDCTDGNEEGSVCRYSIPGLLFAIADVVVIVLLLLYAVCCLLFAVFSFVIVYHLCLIFKVKTHLNVDLKNKKERLIFARFSITYSF